MAKLLALRYACPVPVVRVNDHSIPASPPRDSQSMEEGGGYFSERGNSMEGMVAGGWQMADAGIDMGESNVGKK